MWVSVSVCLVFFVCLSVSLSVPVSLCVCISVLGFFSLKESQLSESDILSTFLEHGFLKIFEAKDYAYVCGYCPLVVQFAV